MSEKITRSIIVKSIPSRAFELWENFENFPRFMKYVKEVHKLGDGKSHWVVQGPFGKDVDWVAETTLVEPITRIGWNTKDREDGDVTTSGQVTFTPLQKNETQITVMMQYNPKGGAAGEVVAKLFANPEEKLEEDLGNFKAYIEGMPARTSM